MQARNNTNALDAFLTWPSVRRGKGTRLRCRRNTYAYLLTWVNIGFILLLAGSEDSRRP